MWIYLFGIYVLWNKFREKNGRRTWWPFVHSFVFVPREMKFKMGKGMQDSYKVLNWSLCLCWSEWVTEKKKIYTFQRVLKLFQFQEEIERVKKNGFFIVNATRVILRIITAATVATVAIRSAPVHTTILIILS